MDNIQKKTGLSPDQFIQLGLKKGLLERDGKLKATVKAGAIVTWLKEEYQLGHGHAMAIYAYFTGRRK